MIHLQIPGMEIPTDSIGIASAAKEINELKSLSFDDLINRLANDLVQFSIHLALAILVFYVGKFIIHKLYVLTHTVMTRRNIDKSLTTFVLSLVNIVLYFILIVTVISILGIETSSFIAIFASAGVAIGMALSGTLQNFAGGVLILLLKPYKIGDYIEAQGFAGTVTEIQIFNTIICTPDNKSIIIPNGPLSTGSINNWSREDYRRIEWTVGISYGDSVEDARKAIMDMFADDSRIVKTTIADHRLSVETERQNNESNEDSKDNALASESDDRATVATADSHSRIWRFFHRSHRRARRRLHSLDMTTEYKRLSNLDNVMRAPSVTLGNLGSSSVDLTIRAWVQSGQYWDVFYHYNERFYNELPSHGVAFPFPQLDVHMNPDNNQ